MTPRVRKRIVSDSYLPKLDTIDLQDQTAPSAKDHSRQPTRPSAIGIGPASPHQAGAMRKVAEEQESQRSPGLVRDWVGGEDPLRQSIEDELAPAGGKGAQAKAEPLVQERGAHGRNGGNKAALVDEADMADADGEDDLDDDDMMDKISSSPSIDDEPRDKELEQRILNRSREETFGDDDVDND
ncbi:MAG: hypothetical protein M1829_004263 [Trizodia sp. TS-e1964]|nr:MAG: hypothetical protein M1829_004263 [Trizodia sp. TS-e1964]